MQSETILKKEIAKEEAEGEMNMCKALEDWYQDGVNEGKELGRNVIIQRMLQDNMSVEQISRLTGVCEQQILELEKDLA